MGIFGVLKALARSLGAFPAAAGAVVATVLFDTLFETALPLLLSRLIDEAVVPARADLFLFPAALMAGGWLLSVVNQLGRDRLLAGLSARVVGRFRASLSAWLQRLPFSRLRGVKPAAWLSMHTADLLQVENLVLNVVPVFLFGVFYLVFGVSAMVVTHPGLGLLVVLGLPLTFVGPLLLKARAAREGVAQQSAETEATAAAQDLLAAQPLLRTYGLGASFERALNVKAQALLRWTKAFAFTGNLTRRLPNLTIHLVQLVLILTGTWLALTGQLKIGEFLAFNLLFANVMTAVLDLASTLQPLLRAGTALGRLEEHHPETAATEPAHRGAAPALTVSLCLEDVAFQYDPARRVLEGLSLEIPAGRRTAVVGASGSGKSTLAALIAGLYPPDRGRLLWDGVDLASVDRADYMLKLGVVFQDNFMFDASLRHNVVLTGAADDEAVWQALDASGLSAWVRSLPEGLDTRAGEGGNSLSGGQRQRLALARALYRKPSLLLLDEATSALDPLTESQVNDTLRALPATIVHITHRLQGIADYDHIVVLGEGRALESGTHAELVDRPGGVYAALWKRQTGLVVGGTNEARITAEGLRSLPLFAGCRDQTLASLSASFLSQPAAAGERLIRQGRPGSQFFVIARGRVEVSLDTSDGEVVLASLADGDFFGEMSLLNSAPTSAHVTASQPTVVLALDKATFLSLLESDEDLRVTVTETARRRREQNSRRRGGPADRGGSTTRGSATRGS